MTVFNKTVLDRDISTLTELGLTLSQAKVYLALAKYRFLDAQTISVNSGVSRPDVYRVLNQLQRSGLVTVIINEPTFFQALPMDECLSTLILRHEQKLSKIKQEAELIIKDYKLDVTEENDCAKPEFVFIPNKEASFNRTKKRMVEVKARLCLLGERKTLRFCLVHSQLLRDAMARNVKLRMIMDVSEMNPKVLRGLDGLMEDSNFGLKVLRAPLKTGFGIYDNEYLAVGTSDRKSTNKYSLLWFTNQQIINLFQDYFEILWQRADSYSP